MKKLEQLSQEIKEVATKEGLHRASQHNLNQASAGYNAKWFKRGAVFGAKWIEERMYSEDDVLRILEKFNKSKYALKLITIEAWFEQFKKK